MSPARTRLARIAGSYDRGAFAYAKQGEALPRDWFDEPRRRFHGLLRPHARVLDVGCGPGFEMADLDRLGLSTVGLDVSLGQLRIARDRLPSTGLARGTALALPFRRGAFDGAWASASLHHLTRDEAPRGLVEIRRILADGGAFYASVQRGNAAGWIRGEAVAEDIWYTFFGEREWRDLLAAAGFSLRWFLADSDGATNEGATGWINSIAIAA